MTSLNEYRTTLQKLLDDYTKQEAAIDKDLHHKNEAVEKDFAEQVTQRENEDVLTALDSEAREKITLIQNALSRIEAETFGQCTQCGKPVTEARLDILPYAEHCIECEEQLTGQP